MEDIQDWLDDLLKLQDLDCRIDRLHEQINSAPIQKKEAQDNLDQQQKSAIEAKEEVRKIELKIKDIASEVSKIEAQRSKLIEQSNSVKDNNTYKALLAEIENCKSRIAVKEDDELEIMVLIDGFKAKFKEAQERLQEAVTRVEQMMSDLDVRVENCRKQLVVLEPEREEQAKKINSELLSRYTRIKQSHGGRKIALVELSGDKCGYCHLKLTAQEILQAKKLVALTTCGNCGSLIYS
jgi:uncharacterized protein